MKKTVNILMCLAMGILLMHSMVPHHHVEGAEAALQQREAEKPLSLINFLEDLFGVDLGDEHLENFHTGRGFDHIGSIFFLSPETSFFDAERPLLRLEQKFTIPRSLACCYAPHLRSVSLRAPPSQVS